MLDDFTLHARLNPCRNFVPYKLAYNSPLCGPCETNALSQEGTLEKGFYYVDGLCAIRILLGRDSNPSNQGDL
jgi:hypothetical protein